MAIVGIGLILAAAIGAVGAPPAATAATKTVVEGRVTAAGKPLAGVPVGFWARTGHRVTSTRTSRTGRFTLRVPAGTLGFAYAGTTPGSTHPLFVSAGTTYVRGVIGAARSGGVAPALYQGHRAASAARLDGGRDLRFRLQRAGRITSGGAHLAGFRVENLAGGVPGGATAAEGVATSDWLVPGRYRFVPTAAAPWRGIPRVLTVAPGTQTVPARVVQGAMLTGRLTFPDGSPVTEQVAVQLLEGSDVVASTTSTTTGGYEIPVGLAPGAYTLRIGVNPPFDWSQVEDPAHVPVAQRTTAQTVVPVISVPVSVAADVLAPTKDVVLERAGSVRATASVGAVAWLEQADGVMMARGTVGQSEAVTFGGLVPGRTYRIVARSGPLTTVGGEGTRWGWTDPVVATAGTTDAGEIAVTREPLKIGGGVTGADHGAVQVTDSSGSMLRAFSTLHPQSWFVVDELIPGSYRLTASVDGVTSTTTAVRVTGEVSETPAGVQARGPAARLTLRPMSGSASAHWSLGRMRGPDGVLATVVPETPASTTARVLAVQGDDAEADLVPGTYTASSVVYSPTYGTSWGSPALSSPWWFAAPDLRVTLKPGQHRDLGAVALHVLGG